LELIARRTGKPTSFFLRSGKPKDNAPDNQPSVPNKELQQLSRLAATAADHQQVIDTGSKILPAVSDDWSEAQIRYYLGRAYVQSSQPAAGLEHLRRASSLFVQLNDPWMVVECMDWEAGALYLLERPEALTLASEALARCRQLSPVPVSTEVRILGHIAAVHTLHHQWKEAISRYEEAIEKAGALRDLSRVARMYNDLSLAYQESGALDKAAAYLHKAVAVHEMLNNRAEMAFAENNLALVLIEQGQLEAAEQHLKTSLLMFDELKLENRRSHAVLTLAELNIARGSFGEAEQFARDALRLATRNEEPMTASLVHQVLGQIAGHRKDRATADREFATAIAILLRLDVPARLIECHTKYGKVLEDRGEEGLALQQLKAAIALTGQKIAVTGQTRSEQPA
jgi:tetratricopeptide (TPR) repeat protein